MKSPNHFLLFLLLSVTLVLSIFVVLLKYKPANPIRQIKATPQLITKSDYKNYISSDIQFLYPPDWNIENIDLPRSENDYSFYLKPIQPSIDKPIVITVQILKNATAKYTFNVCCRQNNVKVIGSNSFYTSEPQTLEGMIDWTYIIGNENRLVRFNLGIGSRDNPPPLPKLSDVTKELNDFNQILSTFKFIGSSEIIETKREIVKAVDIYQPNKLSIEDTKILSGLYWPKLKPFKSGDSQREVYLVNCEVDAQGFTLTAIPTSVPNVPNIAETTLQSLVNKHYGGFPDATEIAFYQKNTGVTYKHQDSGINGVKLDSTGKLAINFYDSVRAYGGGSSRVGCLGYATYFTALQFPAIKSIEMCIDQYPNQTHTNCAMDFQP